MSANYANLANEVVFVLRQSHLFYGHTMATSLHWPLSSVPKVAIVERFNCSYCISSITLLFFFLQSVKGVNRNQWGRYPPHQVLLFGFLYQIYIVKCFVILNEVCAPAFGHLNTVTSLYIKWTIFYSTPLQDGSFFNCDIFVLQSFLLHNFFSI